MSLNITAIGKSSQKNTPFWAQPISKLEFHSAEEQKIKEKTMEESVGSGKDSYGTETDTETQSWFRLPIPKPGFGRTLFRSVNNGDMSLIETYFYLRLYGI